MRDLNVEVSRSVERTIQILNCFGFDHPRLTIDEIVRATRLPKTTAYRILWTLEKNGLIHYEEWDNHYRLGYKLLEYGGVVMEQLDILRDAEPFLEDLQKQTGFSVILAVRQDDNLQYLLRMESNDGFQPQSYVGRRRVLHYGVIGRMLMAHLPGEEVRGIILRHPLEPYTPLTVTDESQFFDELEKIRMRGYGVDVGGTFPGFTGISAPVFSANNEVVAAIGTAGPTFKTENSEDMNQILQITVDTAWQISQRLGHMEKRNHKRISR